MSLLGLSLAIGILIDDAIVVRENIVRHVEMGKDHYTAAREGTDEIGLAVAATTFSIVAVFVPVAFMPGIAGQWFKPFALTIACSVLVSLFVSFSLDPMLSAYWPDPHRAEHEKSWVTRILDRFNNWFNRQAENYRHVVAWALDHRLAMVALAVLTLVVAMALPATGVVGTAFLGEDDNSELSLAIETPPGSNLDYTRLKVEEVTRIIRRHPEVTYTFATIGGASGTVDEGSIYTKLMPKAERNVHATVLARQLRAETSRLGGVTVSVFVNSFGGNLKQIQLQLRGKDGPALQRAADMLAAEVRQVRGAVDVGLSTKGQKPELEVDMNRGLAGTLGLSVGQVAQSLYPAFAGIDAGDWVDPSGETRDVEVRLAPESRERVNDLAALPLIVQTENGVATVPLGQVATIRRTLGPAVVNHLDRERVINVQANTSGRPLGEIMKDINARVDAMQFPPGVRLTQGGESKDQAEVFGGILSALGIAVLLMYLILVMQFGSFLDPLAILISLPLSLIGVMLALAITGKPINIMSMIGVILLAGIVAKNAILLIDFAKWARERDGLPLREALIEAGAMEVRLAPESRERVNDLAALPLIVQTENGVATVPLGQVATIRRTLGPAVVNHLDRERVINVQANTSGRPLGEIMKDINARVDAMQFPPGVRLTQGGESKDQAEVFGGILSALGIAVLLMYLILVMQFGSFLDPLAILISLPLSLIGVMLALAITGKPINIMSMIGVILLAGIVAKNAILLIDFAKWARERDGLPLREALIEAGAIRLRPILMTTFALIAGMMPIALGRGEGAEWRAPLGIAVIGGVITSTLLTLLVIPTFYEIFDQTRTRLARRFGRRPSQRTAEHRVPPGDAVPVTGD
jgi:multidrug efflux pump subunit AcrB